MGRKRSPWCVNHHQVKPLCPSPYRPRCTCLLFVGRYLQKNVASPGGNLFCSISNPDFRALTIVLGKAVVGAGRHSCLEKWVTSYILDSCVQYSLFCVHPRLLLECWRESGVSIDGFIRLSVILTTHLRSAIPIPSEGFMSPSGESANCDKDFAPEFFSADWTMSHCCKTNSLFLSHFFVLSGWSSTYSTCPLPMLCYSSDLSVWSPDFYAILLFPNTGDFPRNWEISIFVSCMQLFPSI